MTGTLLGEAQQKGGQAGHGVLAAFGGNNTSGPIDIAAAVNAHGGAGRMDFESETSITHSLRGEGFDASEDGTGRGTPLVLAFHHNAQVDQMRADPHTSASLTCSQQAAVATPQVVRRLTPLECERLQGFPDGYTRIPLRAYPSRVITASRPADRWELMPDGRWMLMAADGPRYKALGNSWAVPNVRWIADRL